MCPTSSWIFKWTASVCLVMSLTQINRSRCRFGQLVLSRFTSIRFDQCRTRRARLQQVSPLAHLSRSSIIWFCNFLRIVVAVVDMWIEMQSWLTVQCRVESRYLSSVCSGLERGCLSRGDESPLASCSPRHLWRFTQRRLRPRRYSIRLSNGSYRHSTYVKYWAKH